MAQTSFCQVSSLPRDIRLFLGIVVHDASAIIGILDGCFKRDMCEHTHLSHSIAFHSTEYDMLANRPSRHSFEWHSSDFPSVALSDYEELEANTKMGLLS